MYRPGKKAQGRLILGEASGQRSRALPPTLNGIRNLVYADISMVPGAVVKMDVGRFGQVIGDQEFIPVPKVWIFW